MSGARRLTLASAALLASSCVVSGVEPPTLEPALLEARRSGDAAVTPPRDAGETDAGWNEDAGPPGMCGRPATVIAGQACLVCIEEDCCEAVAPCTSGACLALLRCAADCVDEACADACARAAGDEALGQALALRSCWARRCAEACPEEEASTNLVGAAGKVQGAVAVDCAAADHCANAACADCNGDPTDFCEASLRSPSSCGACGRSCGGGACSPSGACEPAAFAQRSVLGFDLSPAGIAWTARGDFRGNLGWRDAASGESTLLVQGFEVGPFAEVVITPGQIYVAGNRALFRIPPAGGVEPTYVLSSQRGRLLGATAGHVYASSSEGAQVMIARFSIPAEVGFRVACVAGSANGGAVDSDGTVYLAAGDGLVAVPANTTYREDCVNVPTIRVADGHVVGMAAASGRLAWALSEVGAPRIFARWAPTAAPVEVGRGTFNGDVAEAPVPLLWLDDELVFLDGTPLGPSQDHERHLVAISREGARRVLAVASRSLLQLRADATHIYLGEFFGGLRRTPR